MVAAMLREIGGDRGRSVEIGGVQGSGYRGISVPGVAAMFRACASGESPPQGMRCSRFLAMAMDLVGGSSTCAQSPWKEMRMRRVRRRKRRGRVSRCDHGGYGHGRVQPWEGMAMGGEP